MMKRIELLAVSCLLTIGGMANAQVPSRLGYEGRLLKADGTPAQGVHQFTFALWPSSSGGTTPLWADTYSVAVVDGLYSAQLGGDVDIDGGANPLPPIVFDGTVLYLEITVDGETLSPRQSVGSVAYAIKAGSATNATNLSGGTVDASSVNVNGNPVVDSTGHLTGAAAADFLKTAATNAPLTGNGTLSSPIGIPKCTSAVDGYLSAADWNTFNNKVSTADPRLSDARTPLPGSGDYIQNNTSSAPQSASFNISGNAYIGTNVGIGNSNPQQKLDVAGAVRSWQLQLVGAGQLQAQWVNIGDPVDQKLTELIQQNGVFTGRFVNDAYTLADEWIQVARNPGTYTVESVSFPSGKVGIGTTTPAGTLNVRSDATAAIGGNVVIDNLAGPQVNNQAALTFRSQTNGGVTTGARIRSNLRDGTTGAEKYDLIFSQMQNGSLTDSMFIQFDGKVGIGTSSPGAPLDVQGDVRASGQIVSTAAQGTAPLSVNSTTQVNNLNADQLNGMHAEEILCRAMGGFWQGTWCDSGVWQDGSFTNAPTACPASHPNRCTPIEVIERANAIIRYGAVSPSKPQGGYWNPQGGYAVVPFYSTAWGAGTTFQQNIPNGAGGSISCSAGQALVEFIGRGDGDRYFCSPQGVYDYVSCCIHRNLGT